MNTAPPPAELSTLRELVVSLQAALEESRRENTLLRQKIDSLVRRVFGSSSERLDRAQLELLLQLPVLADTNTALSAVEEPKVSPGRFRKERFHRHSGQPAVGAGTPPTLGSIPTKARGSRPMA
jgi:hypothetical protein